VDAAAVVASSPLFAQLGLQPVITPAPVDGSDPAATAASAAAAAATNLAALSAAAPTDDALLAAAAASTAATAAAAAAAAPFEWADGPLVTAMREGALLLVDEVNLADDAVLERLNSVLEPGRSLTLAEKGGTTTGEDANGGAEVVVAHPAFRVVATMNPGGDYGKRELSPALANRFTTVWAPAPTERGELAAMAGARLGLDLSVTAGAALLDWWTALGAAAAGVGAPAPPLRDLLAAARLVADLAGGPAGLHPLTALAHAAHGAVLDGLAACSGGGASLAAEGGAALVRILVAAGALPEAVAAAAGGEAAAPPARTPDGRAWGVPPFTIPLGDGAAAAASPAPRFAFAAPAVARNAARLLRAVCAGRPVLLEGAPGVGKTALVTAVAAAAGRQLVRINLSEQTDVSDLLGGDLPVACSDGDATASAAPAFAWADGPLLAALRSGAWVLLDELNLAGPAVLEGLNAVLDHRRSVFLPELGITVNAPPSFAVFAAQNDAADGGGRRRLPRSFISRFSRVWAEPLGPADCGAVLAALHPRLPRPLADRLTGAVAAVAALRLTGPGGPWEFNLRDLLRWADAVEGDPALAGVRCVFFFGGGIREREEATRHTLLTRR